MKTILTKSIITGCLVCLTFSVKAATYYLKAGGVITTPADWGTNSDGSGTHPGTFTGANTWNLVNNATLNLTSTWGIPNTAIVNVGDNISPITFSVTSMGRVGSAASPSLKLFSISTLYYDSGFTLSASKTTFNVGSTVVIGPNAAGFQDDYSNLTIAGDNSINGSTSVSGVFTINSGIYAYLSGSSLTLTGTIAGTGVLYGDNVGAAIILKGTGSMGTLHFDALGGGNYLSTLTVSLQTTASSVTLGDDLFVDAGNFSNPKGLFDISGKVLTISNSNATFGAGTIAGSSTSQLIGSPNTIFSGSLLMDVTNKTLNVLVVDGSGSLTIGSSLEILDSVKVSGGTLTTSGNLTLKSTSSLKARIAEITGGGAVTGNITVESFIPGGTAGWRNLGASGVNGLTISNWDGGSGSATGFAMSCADCINDANSAGGYFVSVQGDPAGTGSFSELTSASALTPGTGYWIYDGSSLTSAIDVTQINTGAVVTGNVASGTGLMANPYPSPISVDRLKSHTAITSVDVWNGSSYTSFNGGIPSSAVIPMGQGFYANGATNITFQESDKVSFNTISVLRANNTNNIGSVFQLKVIGSNGDVDQTYLRFHGNATNNFDNDLDAYKRYVTPGYLGYPGAYSKYTTIATLNSNQDYAINSIPYANTTNAVIPVKVKVSTTGTYSISPVDISNLPPTACVTLKDKLLNMTHDLRTGAYVCSINDTTSAARFELTVCADITAGINNITSNSNITIINQDINGAFVHTNFEVNTKAVISAYNVMGQKIMTNKEIEGKELTTYLDLNIHSQVVIIRVTSAKENVTKKIFIN